MPHTRLTPAVRKEEIIAAALRVAAKHGFENVSRAMIAEEADVAPGLVSNYWGTMPQLRRAIMREAVKQEDLVIIAQGLARGHTQAVKAPPELKDRAIATLANA